MSQVNDAQYLALITQGFSGAHNDMMIDWAQANGATSDQYNTAIVEALQNNGATSPQYNTAWMEVLASLGYTNALPEALRDFWTDGGYFILGASFDGTNDYLTRGSDLTGNADGKLGIIAARLRFNGGDGVGQYLMQSEGNRIAFTKLGNNRISVTAANAAGTNILNISSATTYVAASGYINILISFDMAGLVYLYVDDADVLSITNQIDDTIDYTRTGWSVAATTTGALKFNGDCNFLYFNNEESIDFSIEANRRKFFDANGDPVLSPSGNGSVPGIANDPICFFAGQYTTWNLNQGSGGGFTVNGSLARPLS